MSDDVVLARAAELRARGAKAPRLARDPVNQPQVHAWLDAIGEENPTFRDTDEARALRGGPVAPPAMAQVWTMYGLTAERPADDPLHTMMGVLDEAGFTSVLGTNCDQTYDRPLRPGERVSVTTALESVVGPKRTGVGEGWFVTTRSVWRVGEEQVATMIFRVLKFRPRAAGGEQDVSDPSRTVRPMVNRDTAFFWEGTRRGELRIQRCNACGELRHPPGPMCPSCGAADRGHVVASGRGRVHSFVVHHAPAVPGKRLPLVVGVVETEEGVRMVGELRGVASQGPDGPAIDQAVVVDLERIDDELTLPVWRVGPPPPETPVVTRELPGEDDGTVRLPPWELPVTTRLVVASALATRDYQDVHHDPELARRRGSKDIFLNILTTTGLVQRYVGSWAGWDAEVRACELRLGAPAHPGDTVAFSGRVVEVRDGGEQQHVVEVVGTVGTGTHVTARVTVVLGTGRGARS
ncbi:hypothetical protein G7072_07555 [Nocardioides sp. HDW12B]|uniref:FAS1-like dehydratase domain-containing protein n=1 Tax=Nocardioides sp. HDW12B TaxID=2714939 RepID=UPI00140C3EDE|nr:MaoC family dehydratase N-terminal domain-containing protein [Nocardioides sp. HDW12B]QIK66221.1 hypothetical protein G7072_07555 [Nocardioides sp. HDW12B]